MIDLFALSVAHPEAVLGTVAAGATIRVSRGSTVRTVAVTLATGLAAMLGTGALLSLVTLP